MSVGSFGSHEAGILTEFFVLPTRGTKLLDHTVE